MFRWLLCLLTGAALAAEPVPAKVVGVHDGDSITVVAGEKQIKVRLLSIDAPELGQPFGKAAKQALSDLVFGKDVLLRLAGKDRYKRQLAVVMAGGVDVNLHLVRSGWAWVYPHATPHDKTLPHAEAVARAAKRGLWADPAPAPPWTWRKTPH